MEVRKKEPGAATPGEEQVCGQHKMNVTEIPPTTQEKMRPPGCSSMMELALRYARAGYPVLPLRARDKRPATKNGLKDASQDPSQIEHWWAVNSLRNIGIHTEKLIVIDVDPVEGKPNPWLESDEARACFEVVEVVVKTGRGGLHFYFKNTHNIRCSAGKLAPGVDIRAAGGYIVAPGSIHENGNAYLPLHGDIGSTPPDNLSELPLQIVKMLTKKTKCKHPNGIPEGSRNDHMFRFACRARRSGVPAEELHTHVHLANLAKCVPPLDKDEISKIVASALKATDTSDREIVNSVTRSLTDVGNAERFRTAVSGRIRWNPQTKKYLVYNATHWAPDDAIVHEAAKTVLRGVPDEVADSLGSLDLPEEVQDRLTLKAKKHALDSQSAHRFTAMLKLARTEPGMQLQTWQMDADHYVLNVENGTIQLETGVLRPHVAGDFFSYCIPIKYDKNARAPRWETFLREICCGDEELVGFLGRLVGYFLTGDVSEHVATIFWGGGANGKSVFVSMLMALLEQLAIRSESAVIASTQQSRQGGRATPEIARLCGKRLAVSSELDIGVRLNEAAVKDLVGADTLTARHLYAEPFDFKPSHKYLIVGNHLPSVRGSDFGIWRRLILVPFRAQFTKERGNLDATLESKLRRELPGILAWAVQGCLQWQHEGLRVPQAVEQATREFRAETDLLVRFLADACQLGAELFSTSDDLRQAYNRWAERVGEAHISARTLGLKLSENGFQKIKEDGRRGWRGLRPLNTGAQYGAWR